MICAGCTIPPSEMCRRYYPRDKYATNTTTALPKPQPMRFTKLAQNGEGEKTVGKKQHTHSQTITILTVPTHTQYTPLYTCTTNILGFVVITTYSRHSMMTMTLRNILHVMWPSWIEVNYYSILYLRAPPHLKCCITGLSLRARLIHASEMLIHP